MQSVVGDEVLLQIFLNTLSADKGIREGAETALAQISGDANALPKLIRFSCQQIPHGASAEVHHAQHAASICVRNILNRCDWNRQQCFTADVKSAVRECIVPFQCAPHVPELVRRQLLAATQELIRYDYPLNWPTLMPQLMAIVGECLEKLSVSCELQARVDLMLRLKGALGVLRVCCKLHESFITMDADELDDFCNTLFLPLMSLAELLTGAWTQELSQKQQQESSESLLFDMSVLLVELSNCIRIVFKCFHSLIDIRWPLFLCDQNSLERFFQGCIGQLLDATHAVFLPLCHQRISAMEDDGSDLSSLFQESALWRMLKSAESLCLKMVQALMFPKECERRARVAAKYFCSRYLLQIVQQALNMVRWHGSSRLLTSKAYIMSLEILTSAVSHRAAYCDVIAPHADEIFTFLLFPRLGHTLADAELWEMNPTEYVRLQASPVGDLYNAKVVSASFMLSLAVPSRPFHNTAIMSHIAQFVLQKLAENAEEASRGNVKAARVMDAAFYCFYQVGKLLKTIGFEDKNVEWLLTTYVAPATKCPVGFLRARSVLVLSVFAPAIQWSSQHVFQRILSDILLLLHDVELPVRMQICTSLAPLISHRHARDVITPCIGDIIQHYFLAMRIMDNDGVVRTLRKAIKHYHSSLSQWAVQLCEMLVQHFEQVLQRAIATEGDDAATGIFDFNENRAKHERIDADDDIGGAADSIMAADEILDTLTTLVRALPHNNTPPNEAPPGEGLVILVQQHIAPMLFVLLSKEGGSSFGFMDAALKLLTTVLSKSPAVAPPTWRLLLCLHRLVLQGAVDYFAQMLPPLDNYVSVAPAAFLFSPMHELCDVPDFATGVASMTPAQIVSAMCDTALNRRETLRLRELSAVPKMYDAILQSLWQLKQQQQVIGNLGDAGLVEKLVEYIIQTSLQVLGDASNQRKERRTFLVLFVNSIFSAILANTGLAVATLSARGAILPLFMHYIQLARGEVMQAMLRSYDRRLFIMTVASLVTLVTGEPQMVHGVDEVLCVILQSDLLGIFSHREGLLLAEMGMKKPTTSDPYDEWSESDGDSVDDEDEDEEDDDDDDDDEDEEDDDDDDTSELADDGRLQTLLTAARVARMKEARANGASDNDDGEEDDEEENLCDEDCFVSPIDACNAWALLLSALNHAAVAWTAMGTPPYARLCQVLQDAATQRQLQLMMQVSNAMEELRGGL